MGAECAGIDQCCGQEITDETYKKRNIRDKQELVSNIEGNSESTEIVRVIKSTTPVKSATDVRDYLIIELSNGLECILVSDMLAEKSAVAMTVLVGNFEDPPECPGLAHFLEHMLFLGTSKYPSESEYHEFIRDHGGKDNASTSSVKTCFQFDIASAHLEGAIDRFSQFFISPLFTESATDREISAVDSENAKNLQNDGRRQYQFDRSLALSTHPFSKFGTGNYQTLNVELKRDHPRFDLRQNLIEFHSKYYSSSISKLCIVAPRTLSQLTSLAINSFSGMKCDLNIERPMYSRAVYDTQALPALYKLIPIKQQRKLRICWAMPPLYEFTDSKPASMLSSLLGDESNGSILQFLKEMNWATALSAGLRYNESCFALFNLSIDLTVSGFANYAQIVNCVFEYIACMRGMSDLQWKSLFTERKMIISNRFRFQSQQKCYNYAVSLSKAMARNYKRKAFLSSKSGCLVECDVDLYKRILNSYLTVGNMYLMLISSTDFDVKECNLQEKWYESIYKKEEIPMQLLDEWRQSLIANECKNEHLFIKKANPYICSDFGLFCDSNNGKTEFIAEKESAPELVIDSDKCKIYWKLDDVFKKPKLVISILFYTPVLSTSILSKQLTKLLLSMMRASLAKHTYSFLEAGLKYSMTHYDSNAIKFDFSGYSSKLGLLCGTVLREFSEFPILKESFDVQNDKLRRSISSISAQQAHQHCRRMVNYLMVYDANSYNQMLSCLDGITFDALTTHYKSMFLECSVECLIYGNCNMSGVTYYNNCISKYLLSNAKCNKTYAFDSAYFANKFGCLDVCKMRGSYLQSPNCIDFVFSHPNSNDSNSCCYNNYFVNAFSYKEIAVCTLFASIVRAKSFDQLRTKEQLGYIVKSWFSDLWNGLLTFKVLVQSKSDGAQYLDARIEAFLQNNLLDDYLQSLTDDVIQTNKKSLINNLCQKSKNLTSQFQRYFHEIQMQRFDWQRNQKIAECVKKCNKNDIIAFANKYLSFKSEFRNKISVKCNATNTDEKEEIKKDTTNTDHETNTDNVFVINETNVNGIREKLGYLDYPWMEINREKKDIGHGDGSDNKQNHQDDGDGDDAPDYDNDEKTQKVENEERDINNENDDDITGKVDNVNDGDGDNDTTEMDVTEKDPIDNNQEN